MTRSLGQRLHQFNPRAVPGGRSETPVAGDERSIERLGKCDVGSVMGREIVPHIPDARQKKIMRITQQPQVRQVGESCAASLAVDLAGRGVAADHLCDFDIDEMRRVKRLSRGEQALFHRARRARAQQRFEER